MQYILTARASFKTFQPEVYAYLFKVKSKIPLFGEGRGIDIPLEGAVGYTRFKVTKVSKVN